MNMFGQKTVIRESINEKKQASNYKFKVFHHYYQLWQRVITEGSHNRQPFDDLDILEFSPEFFEVFLMQMSSVWRHAVQYSHKVG